MERPVSEIRIIGVRGIPEVAQGDDLAGLILRAAEAQGTPPVAGDVLVVTQKVVSKAEGRVVDLASVRPSAFAEEIARQARRDPRLVELVLRESRRIVRMDQGHIIVETHHGFNCANAGIDASNVPGDSTVTLLPKDPDASAERIRAGIEQRTGLRVAVIISDTFGRPWRMGETNVAIGVAGIAPLRDYRGVRDTHGRELRVTMIAIADELAAAAELATGKLERVPATIIRGYAHTSTEGSAQELVRDPARDIFR